MNWIAKKIMSDLVNELMTIPLYTNQFTNGGTNVKLLEDYIKKNFNIDNSKCVIIVSNGSSALHSSAAGIELYEKKNKLGNTSIYVSTWYNQIYQKQR